MDGSVVVVLSTIVVVLSVDSIVTVELLSPRLISNKTTAPKVNKVNTVTMERFVLRRRRALA